MKRILIAVMMAIVAFSAMCATPSPRNYKKRPRPAPMIKTVGHRYSDMPPAAKQMAKAHLDEIKARIKSLEEDIRDLEAQKIAAKSDPVWRESVQRALLQKRNSLRSNKKEYNTYRQSIAY